MLRRAGGNLAGDRGDLPAGLPGRVPDLLHLFLRPLDLVRDLFVLTSDLVQEVQLIEQLGEAGGLEHDAEGGCLLGRVDLDDALVQPLRRSFVLALQKHELAGLHLVELVQPVELALMQREHRLELVEARRCAVDVVLERVDLVGDDLDLGGEDAFTLPCGLDLLLEHVDPAVDYLLPGTDVLAGSWCGDEEEAGKR